MSRYPRRRAQRERRYSAEHGDSSSYRPRQRRGGGCLAPVQRFFQNVAIVLLIAIGTVVFFCLILLIAFNFRTFIQILSYVLFVAGGLAVLGVLYLVVRIIAAISHKISAASVARSKARLERERVRIEQERVQQARVQVRSQRAKVDRDEYAFYQKYEQSGSYGSPRRTQNFRDDPYSVLPAPGNRNVSESLYRTRNLRESNQQPLVRVLPALSQPPADPEPAAVEASELEQLGMPTKGQTFAYSDYKKDLKPGQRIIGIRKDGTVRVGSRQDFKITLVLGASSSGKSTTVLQECLCLVNEGGLLVVCDPGGFKPDSLIQRMGPLSNALLPGTSLAIEHEDIMQNLERFRVELERRRRGADMTTPILLVIDELNGLLMDKQIKKDLTELIEKFAQQARGYNMYMVLCAQRASGLAAIRNSVISFVCHKCPEMEAEKILPARYARLAPQLGIGQTFVSDANGFIEPLQQIFITPEDIASSVGGTQYPTAPLHSRQTEPLAPRVYGAPARRQSAPSQQKLVLRRTTLVQDQDAIAARLTHTVPQPFPAQSSAAAIWGEETQASSLDQSSQPPLPKAPPMTEELIPDKNRPFPTNPGTQPRQDTFEMLALRRKKKK